MTAGVCCAAFIIFEECLFYISFAEIFYHAGVLDQVECFSTFVEMMIQFLLFIPLM